MSTSDTGRLVATGPMPGTTLTVFDDELGLAASGRESVELDLLPGAYQVEARIGDASESRFVMMRPGERRDLKIRVDFRGVAPVAGLSSTAENQGAFVESLSGAITHSSGPPAGLVFVVLSKEPGVEPHFEVELRDSRLKPVSDWLMPWGHDDGWTIAGKSMRLSEGPYVLRTRQRRQVPDGKDTLAVDEWIDQTIWLSDGWQTLVFVANGPVGVDTRGMSVHMSPIWQAWRADGPDSLALEAVYAGLRSGSDCTPRNLYLRTGAYDLANPMLAIAALHAVPIDEPFAPPWYLDSVRLLIDSVGYHPDVLALLERQRQFGFSLTRGYPWSVPWPPMLDRSYRSCLLPADLVDGTVLPPGSPAERVAPYLRIPGPWLRWTSTEQILADPTQPRYKRKWLSYDEPLLGFPGSRVPDEARRQVNDGIAELADFNGLLPRQIVEQFGTKGLAQRFKLPESLVQAALRDSGEPLPGLTPVTPLGVR